MLVILLCCFCPVLLTAQELVTYPAPQSIIYTQHNDDYTVKVRKPGGEWIDLFEYNVKVNLDKVQDASMAYFDFSGKVDVYIRKNNGDVQSVQVRPLSCNIKPLINKNVITFTLSNPKKLSVEFNGDKLHNLHLFANAIEKERPNPNDPNVMYFGPGIHSPKDTPGDVYKIPSGKTVYIAGGAVVRAKFVCDRVENVRIIGRGIIDQPQRGVEITHAKNVEIEGIIVVNPKHYTIYGGQSSNLLIRNLKSFSCGGWTDGIDLMSCSDVKIDDVFMRNSDDCIAIYGHRWDFYENARNYTISNATLWADIAHPATIGLHGNTETAGDTIENITFKNIDILEHDEDDTDYQGCMAINAGDFNLVRNVRYEDMRIEDFEEGQLLNLRIINNKKYNTGPGRAIEHIYFKNIHYNGTSEAVSTISGLDKTHTVNDITFDNLILNGKKVRNAAEANIRIGGFVRDVKFR